MELWLIWIEDAEDGERYTFGAFEVEDMAREVYEIMLEEWGDDVQLTHFVAADGDMGRKRGKIGQLLDRIRGQVPISGMTPAQIHRLDQLKMELRGRSMAGRAIGERISHEQKGGGSHGESLDCDQG